MRAPGRGSGPALPHNPARRGWGAKGLSCQEQLEKATVTTAAGPQSHPRSATSLSAQDRQGRRQNPMLQLRERKPREGTRPSPGSHSRPGAQPKPAHTHTHTPPHVLSPFSGCSEATAGTVFNTAHTTALSESLLPPGRPRQRTRSHERSSRLLWRIGAWPRLQRAEGEPQARETATSRQQGPAQGDGLFISSYYAIKLI